MFTLKTYEELEKIVNDWINGDDGSSDNDYGTSRGGSTSTSSNSSSSNESSSTYKSLDDAFADLEDI